MSKTLKTFRVILEYLWLVVFVVLLGMGIQQTLKLGIQEGYQPLLFALVALFFFYTRRKQRLKEKESLN